MRSNTFDGVFMKGKTTSRRPAPELPVGHAAGAGLEAAQSLRRPVILREDRELFGGVRLHLHGVGGVVDQLLRPLVPGCFASRKLAFPLFVDRRHLRHLRRPLLISRLAESQISRRLHAVHALHVVAAPLLCFGVLTQQIEMPLLARLELARGGHIGGDVAGKSLLQPLLRHAAPCMNPSPAAVSCLPVNWCSTVRRPPA